MKPIENAKKTKMHTLTVKHSSMSFLSGMEHTLKGENKILLELEL